MYQYNFVDREGRDSIGLSNVFNIEREGPKNLGIKYYGSQYLTNLRYTNRSYQLPGHVVENATRCGILKAFNPKRGASSGAFRKLLRKVNIDRAYNQRIGVVCVDERNCRFDAYNRAGVNVNNLIHVVTDKHHYNYPVVMYCNVRSLIKNFDEFQLFTHEFKPGIIALSETCLTDENKDGVSVVNYTAFHKIRQRQDKHHGGGVSVFVNDSFTICRVKYPADSKIDLVSVSFRSSLLPRRIPFFSIIAFYFPPGDKYEEEMSIQIIEEVDEIFAINPLANIFIVGDFNDLNTGFLDRCGHFKQIVKSPTRGTRMLDKCYTNVKFPANVLVLSPVGDSDHNSILFVPIQSKTPESGKRMIEFREKRRSNYESFGRILTGFDWSEWKKIEDINCAVNCFHEFKAGLHQICFPIKKKKVNSSDKKWMNDKIINAMKKRQIEFKKGNIESCKAINHDIKNEIKLAKKRWFGALIKDKKKGSKDYYKIIKSVTGYNNKTKFHSFPQRTPEQSYLEIRDFLGDLANIHPGIENPIQYETDNITEPIVVEAFEIFGMLRALRNHTSIAPDGIPQSILKEFAAELEDPLACLINKSISQSKCPDVWKTSYLCPIPKVPYPENAQQMRPITISPNISKLCEKIIGYKLLESIIGEIDVYQFGGLPRRSTTQYITMYIDHVLKVLEKPDLAVVGIVTDYVKAYDTIDLNAFFTNLKKMNPPNYIVRWLVSFLTNRTQIIKNQGGAKEIGFAGSNGVPQGTVLGGLVFAITVNNVMIDCDRRLKYVDDLTISITIKNNDISGLQSVVDQIVMDSSRVGLSLNPKKCGIIVHDFRRVKVNPMVKINNNKIGNVSHVKLLGLIVQDNLKWDQHIEMILTNANKSLFIIYIMKNMGANSDILLNVYLVFIRPKLEYGCPNWHSSITMGQSRLLEAFQKRVVKVILGRRYQNYESSMISLKITTLAERRQTLMNKYAVSFFKEFPMFVPATGEQLSGRTTRNGHLLVVPRCRTVRYRKSPVVSFIRILNGQM